MFYTTHPLPVFEAGAPWPSRSAINQLAIGIVCALLFLLFNPFLALFFLATFSVFVRVPTSAYFLTVPVSFAVFFYFREYGVTWILGATDDVPNYVVLYLENYKVGFLEIFTRFIEAPPGYEPLWHLIWWPLINVFDASENTFIFLHYFLIFAAVCFSFYTLSRKYAIALTLVYFLATPISIDSVIHLWRQQLAFSVFLTGVGYHFVQKKRFGKWLIMGSLFMHLSMVFFIAIFMGFETYRKYVGLHSRTRFVVIALMSLLAISIIAPSAISFLDSLGLPSVEDYFKGSSDDQFSVFVSVAIYCFFLLLAHFTLKNDLVNNFFVITLLAVFGIMLAFPGAVGIYIRFLIFAFPLYGIYFFRCYLMNFSIRWLLPIFTFLFFSGVVRTYRTVLNDEGTVRFLAYGHAFDPLMGVMNLLLSFSK